MPSLCVCVCVCARAWTVRYNRCHDQLLLSAGTDSTVNLWRVSSISSAPLLEAEDPAT